MLQESHHRRRRRRRPSFEFEIVGEMGCISCGVDHKNSLHCIKA
jgi:hypothetical protein